jgi:hypothetical protein
MVKSTWTRPALKRCRTREAMSWHGLAWVPVRTSPRRSPCGLVGCLFELSVDFNLPWASPKRGVVKNAERGK